MGARRTIGALAATALLTGMLGMAGAEDAVEVEPSVELTEVVVEGGSATVSGLAVFADTSQPQDVGGHVTKGFAEPELSAPLGIDLQRGTIATLTDEAGEASGLRFTWELSSLPPVVPPEVVRYTWAFSVDGEQYQLQAKSSNLVGTTTVDEPAGHLGNVASDYFQLRGRCEAAYMGTPVSGCYHLTFLEGAFDSGAGTVTIDLPFGEHGGATIDEGSSLVAAESATMSIGAAAQAAVSNTSTSNYINGWRTYQIAPSVELGAGRPGTTAGVAWSPAELAEDGTFSGTVTGLTGTNTTIHARACSGVVCTLTAHTPGS
jgi:hypothetical protein